MPQTTPSASDPIEITFVQQGSLSLDDYAAMAPVAPDGGALDNIWEYDGTGGCDTRPDFVKQDDENIRNGRA